MTIKYQVIGKSQLDRKWKSAIVLQGKYFETHTENSIRTFLTNNGPDNLVIVVTYEVKLSEYEKGKINEGRLVFLIVEPPDKEEFPWFWKTNKWNINLQRLTSFTGLMYAKDLGIELSLKCRSDVILGMKDICTRLKDRYIKESTRFVMSDYTPYQCVARDHLHPHYFSDFWLLGRTEDLLGLFDMRPGCVWDDGRGINPDDYRNPEPCLAECWMKQVGIPLEIRHEEFLGKYFAVADVAEVEFCWHRKDDDYETYMREGPEYLKRMYHKLHSSRCCKCVSQELWMKFAGLTTLLSNGNVKTTMIHSVSFASEGPPHDEGYPFGNRMLDEWGRMCLEGGATSFKGYTPSMLSNEEDRWAVTRYSDEHMIGVNPNYHKIGLGAWRVVILDKALSDVKDGDFVVVHCVNFMRCPDMRYFAKNLKNVVEAVSSFTDFFIPMHDKISDYCSKEVLETLIGDADLLDDIKDAPIGRCRMIIAKATPRNRDFVKRIIQVLKLEPLFFLTHKDKTGLPGSNFHHHTCEQSVISTMAYKYGIFPRDWKNSWILPLRNVGHMIGMGVDMITSYGNSVSKLLPKIAFLIPVDPGNPNQMRNFKDLRSPYSDVFVILSTHEDAKLWDDASCETLVLEDWIPRETIQNVTERHCITTFKKWMGLARLAKRCDIASKYRHIICPDPEISVIRPVDLQFVKNVETQYLIVGDHLSQHSGYDVYRQMLAKAAEWARKYHKNVSVYGLCEPMDLVYTWRSGLPCYRTDDLQNFLKDIEANNPVALASKLVPEVVDHMVYELWSDKVKFCCITHDLRTATVGWSLDDTAHLDAFKLSEKAGLVHLWVRKEAYERLGAQEFPDAYIVKE